jgi:hypothetical protein
MIALLDVFSTIITSSSIAVGKKLITIESNILSSSSAIPSARSSLPKPESGSLSGSTTSEAVISA